MAMKETEGSLRAYFLLAGAVAAVLGFRNLSAIAKFEGMLPTDWTAALYFQAITRIVLAIAFVLAGVQVKAALRKGPAWIKWMLIASGVVLVVNVVVITAALGTELGRNGLIGAAIGIAITIYLYNSVVRLSAEAVAPKRSKVA
jgi:hypothetical protein